MRNKRRRTTIIIILVKVETKFPVGNVACGRRELACNDFLWGWRHQSIASCFTFVNAICETNIAIIGERSQTKRGLWEEQIT